MTALIIGSTVKCLAVCSETIFHFLRMPPLLVGKQRVLPQGVNFWQVLVTNVLINDHFIASMIRTLRETIVAPGAVKRSQENVVPGMESPRPVYSFEDTLRSRMPAPLVVCDCFGFFSEAISPNLEGSRTSAGSVLTEQVGGTKNLKD